MEYDLKTNCVFSASMLLTSGGGRLDLGGGENTKNFGSIPFKNKVHNVQNCTFTSQPSPTLQATRMTANCHPWRSKINFADIFVDINNFKSNSKDFIKFNWSITIAIITSDFLRRIQIL